MKTSDKIRARIKEIKDRRDLLTEDESEFGEWDTGYNDACISRYDEEIDFLEDILSEVRDSEIEREDLAKDSW